jgi:hypothetical protein
VDKAQREQLAVRSIYDEAEFPVFIHQDRPDFVLGFATDGPRFGVEVTELFQTEANARLLHVPDYVTRLFESSWVPWRLLIFERGWSYGEPRQPRAATDASPLHPA